MQNIISYQGWENPFFLFFLIHLEFLLLFKKKQVFFFEKKQVSVLF